MTPTSKRNLWENQSVPLAWLALPDRDDRMADLVQRTVNDYLGASFGWTLGIEPLETRGGVCIVAGNDSNNPIIRELVSGGFNLGLDSAGEEGFRIVTREEGDCLYVVIAGNTPQAVKYGCQELLFFHLRATSTEAWLEIPLDIRMQPEFPYRGAYILPCWAAHDSLESWMRVLEFHSELTLNRNWFWLAGFPILSEYGGEYEGTDLASLENVRKLVSLCHNEAMKFYIGGGWYNWHHEKHAEGSIDRGVQYYLDLLENLPGTQGIFLEPTGEGSTVPEETWLEHLGAMKRLMETCFAKDPEFEFALAIGQFNDPRYRKAIHEMDQERIYWWWCWGDPIRDGALKEHPLVLRWHIITPMYEYHGSTSAPKIEEKPLTGFGTSYDPGQGFGNPWNGWGKLGVDHPRNIHPHTIPLFSHQYLLREKCWNLAITEEEFASRLSLRLFDADMPEDSIRLYLQLARMCPKPEEAVEDEIREIEAFTREYQGEGTPRNQDTLERMNEALRGMKQFR